MLLFLPNEQLTGFIREHDAELLDDALRQNVVLCSPMTLFAFLGVIRQAFDNFMIEQTSDEILQLVAEFTTQWGRYLESTDKLGRHIRQLGDEYERLSTTRQRTVERPLRQLAALRERRGDALDGLGAAGASEPTDAEMDGAADASGSFDVVESDESIEAVEAVDGGDHRGPTAVRAFPGADRLDDHDRTQCREHGGGGVVAAGTTDETPSRHVPAVV